MPTLKHSQHSLWDLKATSPCLIPVQIVITAQNIRIHSPQGSIPGYYALLPWSISLGLSHAPIFLHYALWHSNKSLLFSMILNRTPLSPTFLPPLFHEEWLPLLASYSPSVPWAFSSSSVLSSSHHDSIFL